MPYDSRVYRVLIASPSDVEQERDLAVKIIQAWNDLHSYSRKVVLLPLRWETHTAPEYGTRPQELINRAIVDDCDLLVGVFWTRIGTPSGEAQSGTLEEIERAAKLGKPIMLYFSQIGIDPYQIDSEQQNRLRQFKNSITAKALTATYKSHIEFGDKFSRQLEIKIRDVRESDSRAQPPPLILQLFSFAEKRLVTNASYQSERIQVTDFDEYVSNAVNALSSVKNPKIDLEHYFRLPMHTRMDRLLKIKLAVPIILVITNDSDVTLHNIFLDVVIRPSPPLLEVTNQVGSSGGRDFSVAAGLVASQNEGQATAIEEREELDSILDQWREGGNFEEDGGIWRCCVKWDHLQPQRHRLIEPLPYAIPSKDVRIQVQVRVFADSLPKPIVLNVSLNVTVADKSVSIDEVVPAGRSRREFALGGPMDTDRKSAKRS